MITLTKEQLIETVHACMNHEKHFVMDNEGWIDTILNTMEITDKPKETEFHLGQEVFYMLNNKVETGEVIAINISKDKNMFGDFTCFEYTVGEETVSKDHFSGNGLNLLFASKEDLLNSL